MTGRFVRFVAAGAIGFIVQIAAVGTLLEMNVHYLLSTALGVQLAIVVNFFAHQYWTWRDRGATNVSMLERLLRYNALASLTSVFGSLLLSAYFVEASGLHPIAANVLSVVTLSAINFFGTDRLVFGAGMILAMLGCAGNAHASEDTLLHARTVRAFSNYAANVEARRARELATGQPFLDIERQPASQLARTMTALRRGEVIVAAAASAGASEVPVDNGLINHWRGTVFVPNVTLAHLLAVLQDTRTDQHKQVDVISSRLAWRGPDTQTLFLRVKRTKIVTVVYDTEYDVTYKRLTADRAMSDSLSTRIIEIEYAGTPRERAMPEGNDHGYMWRLNSYWRYKQAGDGVLIEVESLSLSRDLPPIIGPLIRPIVSGVARESMTRTLAAVRGRFGA